MIKGQNAYTRKLYDSYAWKKIRADYYKKVGGLCERCLAKGIYTAGSEVHHNIRLTKDNVNDPTIALNFDNLELLCFDCHHEEHDHRQARWRVDADGRLITPLSGE